MTLDTRETSHFPADVIPNSISASTFCFSNLSCFCFSLYFASSSLVRFFCLIIPTLVNTPTAARHALRMKRICKPRVYPCVRMKFAACGDKPSKLVPALPAALGWRYGVNDDGLSIIVEIVDSGRDNEIIVLLNELFLPIRVVSKAQPWKSISSHDRRTNCE